MASKGSRVPPLTGGPVPLKEIQDKARSKLVDIIDTMVGAKAIAFDPEITGPLGLVVPGAMLIEHGVEKMFNLQEGMEEPDTRNIIYMARANVVNAQLIAKQIKSFNRTARKHEYSVFFIPRLTCLCEKVFEEEGVKGDATLGEYPMEFIAFDDDVLSMELEHSFREIAVEGDFSALYLMARGLTNLQMNLGSIPRITGIGPAAEHVKNMCMKMRKEFGGGFPNNGKVNRMILIDRAVDLITPLVTQVTYEGIIDEVIGLKNNCLSVEVAQRSGLPETKKYILNSSDMLHKEMRDIPWPHAAPRIRSWVQKMRMDYQNIKDEPGSKTVSEMHDFTNRLKQLGSTEMHSNISAPIGKLVPSKDFQARLDIEHQIIEEGRTEEGCKFVEDLLCQGRGDFFTVLRLLCLLSLTNNGITRKVCDQLRRTLLLVFGYENMMMLNCLEQAKVLKPRPDSKNTFPAIKRAFNLVYDMEEVASMNVDGQEKGFVGKDIGYIYWGYAPLSIRLVELALKQPKPRHGTDEVTESAPWKGRGADALYMLPGKHFDVMVGDNHEFDAANPSLKQNEDVSETVLVVFLGGVTFSEISALRMLSALPNAKVKFVVATTKLINGNTFLQSFQDGDVRDMLKLAKENLLS